MVFRIGDIVTILGLANLVLSAPADSLHRRQSTIVDCLEAASVPVISNSSPNYAAEVIPYNLRTPFFPIAAAVPETADQVSSAVICAKQFGLKVAARSGGHSYAGFGLGGQDGSLMIDMKTFKYVNLDPVTQIATIGAGTRLGDVSYSLYNLGGRALPHGLCPGVGISGHALHGGYGFASRMWGTTLDTILEMEVVLADGSIVTTSRTENEDLFWALRGAGSSFGIVTKFKLQTLEAPANGVRFTYSFGSPTTGSNISYHVQIFRALQEYAQTTAPKELSLRLWTLTDVFEITGVYWGTRENFDAVIAPLVSNWPAQTTVVIEEDNWLDTLVALANGATLPQPIDYTQHDTFLAKSIVAPELLTSNALTSFFNYHQNSRNAPVPWWVIGDLYGGTHSNISSFSLDSASYAVRNSLFTFQLYATTTDQPFPAEGITFMNGLAHSLISAQPETHFTAYPNYIDPTLSASDAHNLYYGSQYQRLLNIKRSVDPEMRFWNPQAIGV